MDKIRYAYSPATGRGWSVGIRLDADVKEGTTVPVVQGGNIVARALAEGRQVQAEGLPEEIRFSPEDNRLKRPQWEQIVEITSKVILKPALYPWVSYDGALSALHIQAGSTVLTAEWNVGHAAEWCGLQEFHELMDRLFRQHPLARIDS